MQTTPRIDAPPLTYEEYFSWTETNTPCEVVDGRPIVSPTPSGPHQLAVVELTVLFHAALPEELKVVPSPWDWVLQRDPLVVRQPDLVVVEAEQVRRPRLTSAPLLAVEILSPTSRERDLVTKRRQYAAAGVAWYWLIDLDIPQILVLRNIGGEFEQHAAAAHEELLAVSEPFDVQVRPAGLL